MNRVIRAKLAMVSRVREFCRANPSGVPGYVEAVNLLEQRLARAEAMAVQQESGFLVQWGSTRSKAVLRRIIRERHLRHLVRIARGATSMDPSLPLRFRLPPKSLNGLEFIAAARAMTMEAASWKELFIREGMPTDFLETLEGLIGEYEVAVSGQHEGTALHIGARCELRALASELMQLVRRFDGLNLLRFEDDPEKQGAWLAARDVVWPYLNRKDGKSENRGIESPDPRILRLA